MTVRVTQVWFDATAGGAGNTDSTASPGSYEITGAATTILRALLSTASSGSYTLNGSATTATRSLLANGEPSSYSLSGSPTTVTRALLSTASPGNYEITGAPATGVQPGQSSADPGSYTVLGFATTIVRALLSTASPGSYTVTGSAAEATKSKISHAEPSFYAINGAPTSVLRTHVSVASPGSYDILGAQAWAGRGLLANAEAGIYVLTGSDATATVTIAAEAQYARPDADLVDGAWLPSTPAVELYTMVDEAVVDDADYIYTSSASTCELSLQDVVDPGTSSGQVLRLRLQSAYGNGIVVTLKQGAAVIATRTYTAVPASWTDYTMTLTSGECDALTPGGGAFSNLSVELTAQA